MSPENTNHEQSNFVMINCQEQIVRPIDMAWERIGGFKAAGKFLDVSSRLLSGDGGLGSIRLIAESISEVMVGSGEWSYTYWQTIGPMASFGYHGCVSLQPNGPTSCILNYTIIYNQQTMDPAQRLEQHGRISRRFLGAVRAMKQEAER